MRLLALVFMALGSSWVQAEPYIAVQMGYKCSACHINPTGGGLRNSFGTVYAENVMPARGLPRWAPAWTGGVARFLSVGGDLRASQSRTEIPAQRTQRQSLRVDQFRLYASLQVLPDRVQIHADEQLSPGDAQNLEGYLYISDRTQRWYLKGGRFYLPFGWRLQDQTALVRETSGISMTEPDTGLELGIERDQWSAQIDLSRGAANLGLHGGYQATAQMVRLPGRYRLGAAATFVKSELGDRRVVGAFAGLQTGKAAWLGELDWVSDDGFPEGNRRLLAGLAEFDWRFRKGHNLKLSAEYRDPDLHLAEDQQLRWSALYEYSPWPFLQLRTGVRRYRGIPQSDLQNRRYGFIELHAFL